MAPRVPRESGRPLSCLPRRGLTRGASQACVLFGGLLFYATYADGVLLYSDPNFSRDRTNLEITRISTAHRQRMDDAFAELVRWVAQQNICFSFDTDSPSAPLVCELLCKFVQWQFDRGGSFYVAKFAVLAAQWRWRSIRGSIRRAWDCIGSWEMRLPRGNRVPLPEVVLKAMFIQCVLVAMADPRLRSLLLSFAVLLRVAFYGLLRPGEVARATTARCIRLATSRG